MKLVVMAGAKSGTEIPLKKDKFTIGRSSDCTLRAGSESISRHHCAVLRSDKGFTIRDLGSRNGTYVNDEKITEETPLSDGDMVRVGTLEFRFEGSQDIDRSKKSKVKDVAEAVSRSASSSSDSGEIEDDISRWLLGPESGSSVALRETQSFRIDETRAMSPPPPEKKPADKPEEPAIEAEDSSKSDKKSGKKTFGKLPARPPQKSSKDSREAAADVLREMTRRR